MTGRWTLTEGDVRLRPVEESDLDLLHRLHADPDTAGDHDRWPVSSTTPLRTAFTEHGLLTHDKGGTLIVEVDGDGAGQVNHRRTANGVPPWSDCWEIGISLAPEARGRRIGTTAQRLLVGYLFATTPLHRVQATTDIANTAEQRILEHLGFTREGVMRQAQFRDGRWHDMVLYGVLRDEWDPPLPD